MKARSIRPVVHQEAFAVQLAEPYIPESATRQKIAKIVVCPVADRMPASEIGMSVARGNTLLAVQRFCELAQSIFRI